MALHIMKFVIPGEIWNPRKVSHYAGLLPLAGCREGGCNKIVLNMQAAAAAAMDHIFTARRKYTAMRVLAKSVPIHFIPDICHGRRGHVRVNFLCLV